MPKKYRRLWLQVRFKTPGASRMQVLQELINSIIRRDYDYRRNHPNWRVALLWTNRQPVNADDYKKGEFRQEMERSAESSMGFEVAVRAYLESQLVQEKGE